MTWRFFRRLFLLPWLSVNVGKRGASVSVGPRGAKMTVSPDGVRTTVGLPGTGLSTSEYVPWRAGAADLAWVAAFRAHLSQTLGNPLSTEADFRAALAYQQTLGLSDTDLPADARAVVEQLRVDVDRPIWRFERAFMRYIGSDLPPLERKRALLATFTALGLTETDLSPELAAAIREIRDTLRRADMKIVE